MSQQFAKARAAMVVSQLQPNGVSNERVLAAYNETPRENNLPDSLKSVCYLDETVDLGGGAMLLEPMLHAIMVENLEVNAGDRCAVIGADSGYTAAILSHLGGQLVADDAGELDIIFVNGAVAEIPAALTSRLASGGRLAAIVQKTPKSVGKITIATRESSGAVACRAFNDAKVAYVAGYAPKQEFVF